MLRSVKAKVARGHDPPLEVDDVAADRRSIMGADTVSVVLRVLIGARPRERLAPALPSPERAPLSATKTARTRRTPSCASFFGERRGRSRKKDCPSRREVV